MRNKTKANVILNADIAIVGGGGSGLVAAVSAAEHGAKNIIVIEKAARPGGNTYLGVCMMAVDSPAQKRLGMPSLRDQIFKEVMDFARWSINPKVIRTYIDMSGQFVGWMDNKGIHMEVMGFAGPEPALAHGFKERQGNHRGKDPTTGPGFVGSTVVEAMLQDIKKSGITLLTKTRATKLLTDIKGNIKGVLATAEDQEFEIRSKAVIISAGGFGGNKTWLEKYFNVRGDICRNSLGHLTGDGLTMAAEVNAFDEHDLGILMFGPCHHPWASSVHFLLTRPDTLFVNKKGERFINESVRALEGLRRQPDEICYGVVDSKAIQEASRSAASFPGGEKFLETLVEDIEAEAAEAKKTWKADSLGELAAKLGMNASVLEETIVRYNSFCDNGYDEDLVKDKKFLRPVRVPPFYAILGRRGFDTTHGGINVNERMEALSVDGKVINGLYAAGDNAGDWVWGKMLASAHYHPYGQSLTWALCSGYMAGDNAGRYVQGK